MRKIIQYSHIGMQLIALCDDGTLWYVQYKTSVPLGWGTWQQFPAIPQPDVKPPLKVEAA